VLFAIIVLYWHSLRWFDIGAALLYLVNFDFVRPWVIGHLWSLSVEEQFYFLWPSVLKRWHQHRVAILYAVILAAPIARTGFLFFIVAEGGYGNLLTVGDNLATGCLLAMFSTRLPDIRWKAATLMLAAVVLIPLYDADTRLRTIFMLFSSVTITPFLDCRNSGPRGPASLQGAELAAGRLAWEHQLQSLSRAAAFP
jgi:peptidoglycan/LPS O-acetylase OafA/YrhL